MRLQSSFENAIREEMAMVQGYDPCGSATELAEAVAVSLGHDEWLDDVASDLWDIALDYIE